MDPISSTISFVCLFVLMNKGRVRGGGKVEKEKVKGIQDESGLPFSCKSFSSSKIDFHHP